jgi:hypothetical protein
MTLSRWCLMTAAALAAWGCDAGDGPCLTDAECAVGDICGASGECAPGCHGNVDCPLGQVCSAETHTCTGGPDGGSGTDTSTSSDTGEASACVEPGTKTCASADECDTDGEGCACLDLLAYGGYCYPDCSDCSSPHECVSGGCVYVGHLVWDFDVPVIDVNVGGYAFVDFEVALEAVDVEFTYAYAARDDVYGYMWVVAISSDPDNVGGWALEFGVQLSAYGQGTFTEAQMGSSVSLVRYDDWQSTHGVGHAISFGGSAQILTLDTADGDVGGHVAGTLDAPLMEYRYDF